MRTRRVLVLLAVAVVGTAAWGALTAFGGAAAGSAEVPHFAVLNGAVEIGENGNANAGDLDGFGGATVVIVSNRRICFSLSFARVGQIVAAHIHRGAAGQNGPVVVDFAIPSGGIAGAAGGHAGCTNAAAGLVRSIKNNPGAYYVNTHTSEFPAGAIRGQLF
jgi:hypothetical protein